MENVSTTIWKNEAGTSERVLLSAELDIIQIDFPKSFSSDRHFTIFWRGMASSSHLHHFIQTNFYEKEMLGVLYFFPHQKLELPPHNVEAIPSSLDTACVRAYGEPAFLRYEIYSSALLSDNLSQSRYTLWASLFVQGQSLEQMRENEIGLFTTLQELGQEKMAAALCQLIETTSAASLKKDMARILISRCSEIITERIQNE